MNSNLLELITSNYATFSKSDKKVADVFLNNPHQAISSSIAKGTTYSNICVEENDSPENYTKKIFEASISTLTEARKSLDIEKVKRCIDILSCAKRLTFCGLGASATVAHDMMNKFFYSLS